MKWFWNILKGLVAFIQLASPLYEEWRDNREKKKLQQVISSPDPLIDTRRQRLRDKIRENKERAESNGGNVEGDPEP